MTAVYRISHIPPSTNHLHRTGRGRRFRTQEYMSWLNAAGWEIKAQGVNFFPADRYRLVISVPRAWRQRRGRPRDIDNFIKPVCDLLVDHERTPDDRFMEFVSVGWSDVDVLTVTVCEAA